MSKRLARIREFQDLFKKVAISLKENELTQLEIVLYKAIDRMFNESKTIEH